MTLVTRRRLLGGAAATAAGAFGIGGCAAGVSSEPARSGPVTVNVATNDPNYPAYFTTWAKDLSRRPGTYRYTVDSFIEGTDQVVTKLLTSSMSGTALPELPGLEISQFSRLQRQDIAGHLLVDLGTAIPALQTDFFHARVAPYTSASGVYGLESDMSMSVYFYREDLFAKYAIPTDFDTWDDLIALGAKAKAAHGISLAVIGGGDICWMAQLLLQQGGEFFGPDGDLRVDSKEAVTAIDTLNRGLRSGAFAYFDQFYGAAAASSLNQDQIAGFFMPDWFLPFVLKLNAPTQAGRWRIRALPRFPTGGPTSVWGGTGFAVTKGQTSTQAALDLLTAAYATHEGQVQRFLQARYLPTMKSAWTDPRLLSHEEAYLGGQRPFDVFGSVVDQVPTMVTNPAWDVMVAALVIALSNTQLGKQTTTAAITTAAASIRSQMENV